MSMCPASIAPTLPSPVTILTTPGGKPASFTSSPKARAPRGDFSEDLKTMVLPAATAAAAFICHQYMFNCLNPSLLTFHEKSTGVAFQAEIPAQTPNGS